MKIDSRELPTPTPLSENSMNFDQCGSLAPIGKEAGLFDDLRIPLILKSLKGIFGSDHSKAPERDERPTMAGQDPVSHIMVRSTENLKVSGKKLLGQIRFRFTRDTLYASQRAIPLN